MKTLTEVCRGIVLLGLILAVVIGISGIWKEIESYGPYIGLGAIAVIILSKPLEWITKNRPK